ncbi:hypothetical protein DFH08DRAFT_805506 [Mycena albidolilacea]|uniref:Uncharacterized protein n=1 Tax=Mycena albidolilacea TaxID=1033008 RepID=A0AAD7EVZ3_9AGAR|nr:hypothetical protein DFH08DRAFT_805506 [Mycena albidolilacea]
MGKKKKGKAPRDIPVPATTATSGTPSETPRPSAWESPRGPTIPISAPSRRHPTGPGVVVQALSPQDQRSVHSQSVLPRDEWPTLQEAQTPVHRDRVARLGAAQPPPSSYRPPPASPRGTPGAMVSLPSGLGSIGDPSLPRWIDLLLPEFTGDLENEELDFIGRLVRRLMRGWHSGEPSKQYDDPKRPQICLPAQVHAENIPVQAVMVVKAQMHLSVSTSLTQPPPDPVHLSLLHHQKWEIYIRQCDLRLPRGRWQGARQTAETYAKDRIDLRHRCKSKEQNAGARRPFIS